MESIHQRGVESPLVSVITPTYNRARYLATAVRSVLDQTYAKLEHWIIDDGSTDDTAEVLAPLLQDPRLRYVRQPGNQGPSRARNVGLERANGDFICFLDSDDCWLPHKLQRSLATFSAYPDVHVVYGDYIFIDWEGNELPLRNVRRYSGRIVQYMLRDNCVSMNTTMVRRECFEALGGFRNERRFAGDYEVWLRFAAFYRFHYIPERLGYYRIMEDQISTDIAARFASNEEILREFFRRYGDRVTATEARDGWCRFLSRKARFLASRGRRLAALRASLGAIVSAPRSPVGWRALVRVSLRSMQGLGHAHP